MDGRLPIEEIEARYSEEWVLIDRPEVDDFSNVLSGEVVFHSPNKKELHEKMRELHLADFAVLCFKKWREDQVFISAMMWK